MKYSSCKNRMPLTKSVLELTPNLNDVTSTSNIFDDPSYYYDTDSARTSTSIETLSSQSTCAIPLYGTSTTNTDHNHTESFSINQYYLGKVSSNNQHSVSFPEVMRDILKNQKKGENSPSSISSNNELSFQLQTESRSVLSFAIGTDGMEDNHIPAAIDNYKTYNSMYLHNPENYVEYRYPSEVYEHVRESFRYTQGFHGLLAYLESRFNKNYIIDIAKSMSRYRPSIIACTRNLKEEDLIFMEICFQRTLLEYQRFISISGTPTIIWRRTGQVAYAGKEFSILTGWTQEKLLTQTTYIIELMDDESVLQYFRTLSKLTFGDYKGASMSHCTLLTPNKERIRTTLMMTMKRDVFGIPMMIIGNFLPILS